MTLKIKVNKIRCKTCNTILQSTHVHDYKECKCGTMVDGGTDYLRRGWTSGNPEDAFEELSEYESLK